MNEFEPIWDRLLVFIGEKFPNSFLYSTLRGVTPNQVWCAIADLTTAHREVLESLVVRLTSSDDATLEFGDIDALIDGNLGVQVAFATCKDEIAGYEREMLQFAECILLVALRTSTGGGDHA